MRTDGLAQRFGVTGQLVDFGLGRMVDYSDLLEELIELVREDAERLNCVAEVEHAREIVRRGTSAQRQLAVFAAPRTMVTLRIRRSAAWSTI